MQEVWVFSCKRGVRREEFEVLFSLWCHLFDGTLYDNLAN